MTATDVAAANVQARRPILVSYPKSGRTWLRYMLSLAGFEMPVTHAGMGSAGKDLFRSFRGVRASRVAGRLPVFLHRNPIDTVVSLYFQVQRKVLARARIEHPWRYWYSERMGRLPPGDIEAFLRHPRFGVATACAYNRGWLDYLATRSPVLVITYEELRAEPERSLRSVLDFIGHTPARPLAEIIAQSNFESMQRQEQRGALSETAGMGMADLSDPDSAKVRRGEVRGYGRDLRADTIEELRAVAARYGFVA